MDAVTSEKAKYYAQLGVFTASWAGTEFALDLCIDALYFAGNAASFEPTKPRHLAAKIRLFRSAHDRIAKIASLAETANAIADDLAAASDRRHALIHGVGWFLTEPATRILIQRVRRDFISTGEEITREQYMTIDEIIEAGMAASHLTVRFCNHVHALIRALPPEGNY